jgi:hypothetical protein
MGAVTTFFEMLWRFKNASFFGGDLLKPRGGIFAHVINKPPCRALNSA